MDDPVRFIAIAGPPCAGKSTVARHLSKAFEAPHLEVDEFRRRLLPLSDQRVEHRDLAYQAMHLTAELMVPWCRTLVLDATYTASACRAALTHVVERSGGELFVVECRVGPAVAVERFIGRGTHPAIDLTAERVAALAVDYPYFAAACAFDNAADEDAELSTVISCARTRPLDRAGRATWCGLGRPRERTSDRLAGVATDV